MAAPNWATSMKSFWIQHIPTAVGGTVPNWASLAPLVLASFQAGRVVTYNGTSGYQYIMNNFTGTEFVFYGRLLPNTPSAGKARLYRLVINRSSGAVTSSTIDFTTS